ncbi:XRE family transcriptional regulator [Streptomyces sp. AcE210]|uniref:XRE family transcriptional regulator n=1 Tax=Streptomyces sp. AcE210 TaxID=2292703 RepID=UPI000E2FFFD1|nr:XRE family transcriptional regulator [Streptomyces sp. AcE210]RFC78301.1 XRE family transcriptional regulator [Streptomyces sp. AcE210]
MRLINHPLAAVRDEHNWSMDDLSTRMKHAACARGRRSGADRERTPHNRRAFLIYSGAALVALAEQWTHTTPAHAVSLDTALDGGRLDEDLLNWLEHRTDELRATSAHHQKVAALLIEAHRSAVHELLDNARYDQPTAIRLHSMAAQLGQSAGWNEFDNGHHGLAQARWHTATHAAYLAGDHDLGAGILADLAYQATWRAFPKEAVDILALAHSRTHSPAARALLHVRTARALTVLGDRTGTHRALTTATRELDQARPDTTPAWVSWMSPADLEADAGPCHLDLGQPATAAAAIDNGLDLLNGERDRTRAVFTVYRADAALAAHDIPQAAAHARTALDTARATQAARCLDLSTALLGRLQQHRHHPAVRELVEYASA